MIYTFVEYTSPAWHLWYFRTWNGSFQSLLSFNVYTELCCYLMGLPSYVILAFSYSFQYTYFTLHIQYFAYNMTWRISILLTSVWCSIYLDGLLFPWIWGIFFYDFLLETFFYAFDVELFLFFSIQNSDMWSFYSFTEITYILFLQIKNILFIDWITLFFFLVFKPQYSALKG